MLIDFVRSRTAISVVALASLWLLGWPEGRGVPTSSAEEAKSSPPIWTVPEIGALPNDANSGLVRRGRDLITATYAHVGPEVADPASALPATISPAAIAISRPERRSSAFHSSACSENFPTTTPASGRR